MKRRICIGLAVCVLCFVSVTEAHFVQTSFNGLTEGSIKNQLGTGVGFDVNEPWDASTGTIKAVKGYDLVAPAGTMFGLTQSGEPTIVTNTHATAARQQARLIAEDMDGTVWGSFLVKPSAGSRIGIGFNDDSAYLGDPNRFITTSDGDELWVDFDGDDYDVNVPDAFVIGETSLVLFRIQIDANDANDYVSVWINPDLSNFDSETPVAIQEGADFVGIAITRLNVVTYNHGGAADVDMFTLSNGVDGYLDVTGSEGSSGSAYDPDPANDANGIGTPNEVTIAIDVVLSWTTGADPCSVETYNPAIKKHYLYMSADQNVSSDPNLYLVETIDVTGLVETSSTFALNRVGSYKWLVEEGLDDGAGGTYPSGDPNNLMGWVWWFETAMAHYTAYNLDPEDEAIGVPINKVLSWKEGDFANFHKIYFGTNFVDINERDEFTLQAFDPLDPNTETYSPTLVSLTTFYWCIDEYNDITDTTWPCDKVYSFTTGSLEAFNPDPANFAKYVFLDKVLSWTAGADMSAPSHKHHVYFGTNETAVIAASDPNSPPGQGVQSFGDEDFDPGALAPGTTYYWRVDEDDAGGLHPGDVWEFTCTVNLDPNLVAWYSFDEDDPGIVYDTSGNENHGEPRGGVGYAAGTYGQALDCDGSDDYVYTGKTALDLNIDVNKPKSTTAWVYLRAFDNCAIWYLDGTGAGAEWCLTTTKVPDQWLVRHRGDLYGFYLDCRNEWVHFALVYDGLESTVYADGLPMNSLIVDLNTSSAIPFQIGARRGATDPSYFFYGLIDDVRIYDKELSQGEIWAIIRVDLANAWKPRPADKATDVPTTPILMWNPGDYAPATFGHNVYFGADDPANMALVTTPAQPQTPNEYDPGALDLGRTYYWRIDEVNGGGVDAGNTWSFTVIESLVVDSFDNYPFGEMWKVWMDGAGDCAGNDTDSAAILYEESVTTYDGSAGSMRYVYDNDGTVEIHPCGGEPLTRPKYSRGVAKIADLPSGIDPNWLAGGPKALALRFQGIFTNDPNEEMWVELTDDSGTSAKVTYGPPHLAEDDINDVNEESWHQWNIDLQEFVDSNGVSLAEVNAIAIGFGNPGETPSPGWGYGTMYIDDIRLYPARCLLENRDPCFARVDYTRDCVVDAEELDVMFGEWLLEAVSPGAGDIWREAESADTLGTSWRVVTDPGALGGRTYIGSENGDGDDMDTAPGPEWIASYDLNVAGGTYMVLVYARQVGSNSFWFRIVGATSQTHEDPCQPGTGWVNYEGVHFGSSWEWDEVHSYDHGKAIVNWTLPAGSVTLEVGKREDGVHLDGILITDNLALDPATMPPPVAISDLSGDKKVNFKDYALVAERWLDDEGLFP